MDENEKLRQELELLQSQAGALNQHIAELERRLESAQDSPDEPDAGKLPDSPGEPAAGGMQAGGPLMPHNLPRRAESQLQGRSPGPQGPSGPRAGQRHTPAWKPIQVPQKPNDGPQAESPKPTPPKRRMADFEMNFGKNGMAVVAALLVFFGLGSLANLIIHDLTDELRCLLMWLVSLGVLGTGMVLGRRKWNTLSLSVTACGIGSVFISILVTGLYFMYITDVTAILLELLLCAGVLAVNRKVRAGIFLLVSQLGFLVAALFGAASPYGRSLYVLAGLMLLYGAFSWCASVQGRELGGRANTALSLLSVAGWAAILWALSVQLDGRVETLFSPAGFLLVLAAVAGAAHGALFLHNEMPALEARRDELALFLILGICFLNFCSFSLVGDSIWVNPYKGGPKPLFSNFLEVQRPELNQYLDGAGLVEGDDQFASVDDGATTGVEVEADGDREYYRAQSSSTYYIPIAAALALLYNLAVLEILQVRRRLGRTGTLCVCLNYACLMLTLFTARALMEVYRYTGFLVVAFALLAFMMANANTGDGSDELCFWFALVACAVGSFACVCNLEELLYIFQFPVVLPITLTLHLIFIICSLFCLRERFSEKSKAMCLANLVITGYGLMSLSGRFLGRFLSGGEKLAADGLSLVSVDLKYGTLAHELYYRMDDCIVFFFLAALAILINRTRLCQAWDGQGSALARRVPGVPMDLAGKLNNILLGLTLLNGASLIADIQHLEPLRFLLVAASAFVCFLCCRELMAWNVQDVGFAVGIITTIFSLSVLYSYLHQYDVSFVYSLALLVLAACMITVGFRLRDKSYRIFGLFLTLIGVLKLVLIDLSFSNSLGQVLSLLAGGAVCFGVVALYNKMEVQMESRAAAAQEGEAKEPAQDEPESKDDEQ